MNFRFSKSRSLSRIPRIILRNSGRYWDYALHPFWDEMNVGVAQDSVYSFATTSTPELPQTLTYRNPLPGDTATQTSLALATPSSSSVNIHWVETPTCHIFRADVPGLRKEDLSILVEAPHVQITGKRNLEHIPTDINERIQWETPFVRRLRIPTNALIDQMNAMLDHGVLTLTIPKPQILPSVAWFVPISSGPSQVVIRDWNQREQNQQNLHPSQVLIRDWNQQEQNQLDPHGSDIRMLPRMSRLEPRIQDNSLHSQVRTENVGSKEKDDLASDCNGLNETLNIIQDEGRGPNHPVSKTLNITQEEGRGPNAQVTLNININTGKVSAEGESSSVSISPANDGEQRHASPSSSRSPSVSPSISKQRSSLAQIEAHQDKDVDLPPLALKRKSSVQIEDQDDEELAPPSSPSASRRKSSVQIEDQDDEDLAPPSSPSASRRKSSVQREDVDDEELSPPSSPSTSKRKSLIQTEDQDDEELGPPSSPSPTKRKSSLQTRDEGDENLGDKDLDTSSSPNFTPSIQRGSKVENIQRSKEPDLGRRKTDGDALQASQKLLPIINRRKTAGDVPDQTNTAEEEIPQERRKSQLRRKTEGNLPQSQSEKLEGRKTSKFDQRGSIQRRKTGGDVAVTASEEVESPQITQQRESMVVGRKSSKVVDDEEEGAASLEGPETNERRRSSKRGSRRESSRETSPAVGEGVSDVEGSPVVERRRSTKRGSSLKERRESTKETSPETGEGPSNVEDFPSNERRRSTKRGSNSMERRESTKESSPENLRRKSEKGSFAQVDESERKPSIYGVRRPSTKR